MSAKWQDWASFALGLLACPIAVDRGLCRAGGSDRERGNGGLVLALASHFECAARRTCPSNG